MNVIFGPGVSAPVYHPSMTLAIPAITPSQVEQQIRLDLCRWYTSGFK